jgi:hypothetical protein
VEEGEVALMAIFAILQSVVFSLLVVEVQTNHHYLHHHHHHRHHHHNDYMTSKSMQVH